ncbi:NAD(P)H-hydrate epimerase [Paenirhodobacter sp.]|uniref:NAD(P)H-hydrate epimerase n=1 Tax=Paenirhodobacter sp. TaxID=1965326 RepID=UPI003B416CED
MPEILTSAQMRAIEAAAIAEGSVTGLELMERAGAGAAAAIQAEWPEARDALILCGPGNNGGDGYVVARLLAARGWRVAICATRTADRLPPDAQANAQRCAALPILGWSAENLQDRLTVADGPLVVIDALLGIGQTTDCSDLLAPWNTANDHFANLGHLAPHTVSLDVPTGYESDSGALRAKAPFEPELVVTFHAEKPVHQMLRNQGVKVVVVDIGLGGESA